MRQREDCSLKFIKRYQSQYASEDPNSLGAYKMALDPTRIQPKISP